MQSGCLGRRLGVLKGGDAGTTVSGTTLVYHITTRCH